MRARPWPERIAVRWLCAVLVVVAIPEAEVRAESEPEVAAEPAPESPPPPAPAPASAAEKLPHAHVTAGDVSLAAFSGYGFGFVRAPAYRGGETDDVDAVPLFPQIGYRLTDRLGGGGWYAGSFELLLEGTLLWQTQPRSGFAGGAGLLLRYDLLSVPYVVPFGEIGGGMLDLDFGLDDQADGFTFTLHGGVGLRYFLDPAWAVSLAYRWQHLSNAGTTLPNDGIDLHEALFGVTYVFDRVF